MQLFNVYHKGEWIDEVFYTDKPLVECDEVKKSLVNQDGYPEDITIRKECKPRIRKGESKPSTEGE